MTPRRVGGGRRNIAGAGERSRRRDRHDAAGGLLSRPPWSKARMRTRRFLTALLVLTACGGDGFLASTRFAFDLRSARAPRESAGVDSYEMTVRRLCFCVLTGPVRIVVEDGVVVSRMVMTTGQPLATGQAEYYPDVPGLFAIVDEAMAEADDVDTAFDATYGFPSLINVDWAADHVDDEVTYRTEGFTARP